MKPREKYPDWYPEWLIEEMREIEIRLPEAPPGSKEAVLSVAGLWAGDLGELDQLLEDVMRDREASIIEEPEKP
jgi:hypothetical protein